MRQVPSQRHGAPTPLQRLVRMAQAPEGVRADGARRYPRIIASVTQAEETILARIVERDTLLHVRSRRREIPEIHRDLAPHFMRDQPKGAVPGTLRQVGELFGEVEHGGD